MSNESIESAPHGVSEHPEATDEHSANGTRQMAEGAAQFASGAKAFYEQKVAPAAKAATRSMKDQLEQSATQPATAAPATGWRRHAPKALAILPAVLFLAIWLPLAGKYTYMSISGSDGPYILAMSLIALSTGAANLYLHSGLKAMRIAAALVAIVVGALCMASGFYAMSELGASLGGLVLAFSATALAAAGLVMLLGKHVKPIA